MNKPAQSLVALLVLLLAGIAGAEVRLEQVISREFPGFSVSGANLTVGEDGRAYFSSAGFIMRIDRDGSNKSGFAAPHALNWATANKDGVIGSSHAHFSHAVYLWNPAFGQVGVVSDFLNSDATEYFGPSDVQAGASGDFYGIDNNRDRILRITPDGKISKTYSLAQMGESLVSKIARFRVAEGAQRFFVISSDTIRAVSFDGKLLWTLQPGLGGNPWDGWGGGFDVDDAGNLYVLKNDGELVQIYGLDGKPSGEFKLDLAGRKGRVSAMQIHGNDVVVRRPHPAELFAVYDRATGALNNVVRADVEELNVTLDSLVWTQGQPTKLKIDFNPGSFKSAPQWQARMRLFNSPAWQTLKIEADAVNVPADASGLYQLQIANGEYKVETFVEIRVPNAKGSATIVTPESRAYFAAGEEIEVSILLRGEPENLPAELKLELLQGGKPIWQQTLATKDGIAGPVKFPTSALQGAYLLTTEVPGLTVMPMPIVIGPGRRDASPIRYISYGDYQMLIPVPNLSATPEGVSNFIDRSNRLGLNFFVDRLGNHLGWHNMDWNGQNGIQLRDELVKRLTDDPIAIHPQRVAAMESPGKQQFAAMSAAGMQYMGIPNYMDDGLPIGTAYHGGGQESDEAYKAINDRVEYVTKQLRQYQSFRGWNWTANWWVGKPFAASAPNDAKKKQFEDAIKVATDTGKYDPIIDEISDIWLGHAVRAQDRFSKALHAIVPGMTHSSAGAYRHVAVYPPITFSNVDEIDLHYQAEQIAPPQTHTHAVDYQRLPNKPNWGHPELFNDIGNGDQIVTTMFQQLMRGAAGTGTSGPMPNWGGYTSTDLRTMLPGATSAFRLFNDTMRPVMPLLEKSYGNDKIAILASSRMHRFDGNWTGKIGSRHFDRIYLAHQALLYAKLPARIEFVDGDAACQFDLYKAAIIVDQRVDLDDAMKKAIADCRTVGVPVFYDGTCRPEVMAGLDVKPLGVTFDAMEQVEHAWQDDSAYWEFPHLFTRYAAPLRETLLPLVGEVPDVDAAQVLLSERIIEQGRYVFVVNNTAPDIEPGLMWRTTSSYISTKMPIVANVKLPAGVVYDLFAMKKVDRAKGETVRADLRGFAARVYAILPAEIESITPSSPKLLAPGQSFGWNVIVRDRKHESISAGVPVRVTLADPSGATIRESVAVANSKGATGTMTMPLAASAGEYTLRFTELLSGIESTLQISVDPAAPVVAETVWPDQSGKGSKPGKSIAPESRFGPHLRDGVLSTDGRTILFSAANWRQNCFAVDAATGEPTWQAQVGDQFAFGAGTAADVFTTIGVDVASPYGYHLYLVNSNGTSSRRFALPGLPRRPTLWAFGGMLVDKPPQFAHAPSGAWVAAAGDLGIAVWTSEGTPLWTQEFWKSTRKIVQLAAAGEDTLVVADGITLIGYDARSGAEQWKIELGSSGSISQIVASADGNTVAAATDVQGGRVFVVRGGKVMAALPTAADLLSVSADGARLAVTRGSALKMYSTKTGFAWQFDGDDNLHFPRFSIDGGRIAFTSSLGSIYIFSSDGELLRSDDLNAWAVPVWRRDGGLVVGTWDGRVVSYSPTLDQSSVNSIHINGPDVPDNSLQEDPTPTTAISGWTNDTQPPMSLQPNLIAETKATVRVFLSDRSEQKLQNDVTALSDDSPDAPAKPWVSWYAINLIDSGWQANFSIVVDTFNRQLRVNAVTLVEDPKHPASWLRDAVLQYWDESTDKWTTAMHLRSDSAKHTHVLPQPVEAGRFRLVKPDLPGTWPAGNIRLAELVLHGQALGASHPDVVAKKPVAVLFDESILTIQSAFQHGHNPGVLVKADSAALSGGNLIVLDLGADKDVKAGAAHNAQYGHAVPTWDFEIAGNPEPGQYRYLQFAWRALAPETKGLSFGIAGIQFHAGLPNAFEGMKLEKQAETPPQAWQVVTVDLWKLAGEKPLRITTMSLGTIGGPGAFDLIRLGRTEGDLKVE